MLGLIKKLSANRNLLKNLVIRDLKHRYVGSMGGFLWSVINPLVLLVSYTFVFTVVFPQKLGPEAGRDYPEVSEALLGHKASMVQIIDRDEVIVSVAVPVQRFRAVRGALMLSTQGADIDDMVTAERLAIFKVMS